MPREELERERGPTLDHPGTWDTYYAHSLSKVSDPLEEEGFAWATDEPHESTRTARQASICTCMKGTLSPSIEGRLRTIPFVSTGLTVSRLKNSAGPLVVDCDAREELEAASCERAKEARGKMEKQTVRARYPSCKMAMYLVFF